MDNLTRRILSDPVNRWVFSTSKSRTYLVGGYLRDLLLKDESADMDFVVEKDCKEIARRAAKRFNGRFVILKKKHTCRVILKNRRFIDFSLLKGSINNNLGLRDFTINAMAWSTEGGIVDPYGGYNSLKKRVIQAVLPANINTDPVRILRAYRISAEKGFRIEKDTLKCIGQNAVCLQRSYRERITEELFRILKAKSADKCIVDMYKNNVMVQLCNLSASKLSENLKLLRRYSRFIEKINGKGLSTYKKRKIKSFLNEKIRQNLNRNGLIKLAIVFMNDINIDKRLMLSRGVVKGISDIQGVLSFSTGMITDKGLYQIFRDADKHFFEAAILLSAMKNRSSGRILNKATEYTKMLKRPLITGDDIQELVNIERGVIIGRILDSIEELRFLNKIRNKAQAKAWIISNFT